MSSLIFIFDVNVFLVEVPIYNNILFASRLATAFLHDFYVLSWITTTAVVFVPDFLFNTCSDFWSVVSLVYTAAVELIDHDILGNHTFLQPLNLQSFLDVPHEIFVLVGEGAIFTAFALMF